MSLRTKWKQWVALDHWFQNPVLEGHNPARKPGWITALKDLGFNVPDLNVDLNINISFTTCSQHVVKVPMKHN